MITWTIFKTHILDHGLTQNQDTMALNAHNRWCILFYHVWGPTWIKFHWNSIWLRVTFDFTLHLRVRDHTIRFWRCLGTTFGHFLLGSHNFMVTALGSCVKQPLCCVWEFVLNLDMNRDMCMDIKIHDPKVSNPLIP
jgi:hypothetical protein